MTYKYITQEQKAKAYDEALERMKSWVRGEHPEYFTEAQKVAEFVFPELKESEDEKIRKKLIENFKWFCGDYPETTKWGKDDDLLVKDIIAWLEKQGNKSINIDIESMVSSYKQRLKSQGGVGNSPLVNMCLTAFRHGVENTLEELNLKELEKQNEQKPNPYSGISFEYNGHTWGMCARDNGVDILLDEQLFKHLEKQGEQKPAWSEEDELTLLSVIQSLELTNGAAQIKIDWLKSLKQRLGQGLNPNEVIG